MKSRPLIAWSLTIGLALSAHADESNVDEIRKLFDRFAGKLRILHETSQMPLELVQRPVLNWSNPVRKTPAGGLFLWTLEARPHVAMCIYPSGNGNYDMEFQSLSESALSMHREDELVWNPNRPGTEWKQLETPLVVAESPTLRLSQMRRLASQFEARLVFGKKADKRLRMQSTPVYRYPAKETSSDGRRIVDGAVFTFVQGTDPEAILIIEAIEDEEKKPQWQFAMGRMTMVCTAAEFSRQDRLGRGHVGFPRAEQDLPRRPRKIGLGCRMGWLHSLPSCAVILHPNSSHAHGSQGFRVSQMLPRTDSGVADDDRFSMGRDGAWVACRRARNVRRLLHEYGARLPRSTQGSDSRRRIRDADAVLFSRLHPPR